ncbi:MAG: hypothetical protein PWP23_2093 [Candidatus Sumerlaeota bacterium]|nr:hypothetical protein [Candidatus Sumerlaeota bacterium]
MSGLRIAVVSDEGTQGGASIACTRLCLALRAAGHTVARIHHARFAPDPQSADVFYAVEQRSFSSKVLDNLPRNELSRRVLQQRWAGQLHAILHDFEPDIVNLHNLHNAKWDIEIVEEFLRHTPVVWTLHDMWALTGSCAYSFACRQFETGCTRACPQVGTYPTLPAGMVPGAHARRRALWHHAGGRLVFVAPSRWLAGEARRAAPRVPAKVIPNGLDLDVFRPRGKAEARAWLGVPDDERPVLLTAASSLADPRKGTRELTEALGRLGTPVRLLMMGRGEPMKLPGNVESHLLGPVTGDPFLALAINAADAFVLPSKADNLPLVVQEAMACAVPCLGTAVGGIPEMIADGETGWLAGDAGPDALLAALEKAFAGRTRWPEMGAAGRRRAERGYSAARQAERYTGLFRRLLSAHGVSSTHGCHGHERGSP